MNVRQPKRNASWLRVSPGQFIALLLVASIVAAGVAGLQSLLALAADPVSRRSIGQQLLEEQRPLEAAVVFEHTSWQAVANFRAGRYRRAAELFQTLESTEALYNYGVSLARLRRWDDAVAAFRVVLDASPNHADARFNYDLIRKIIATNAEEQARLEGADQGGQLHEISEDVEQSAEQSPARGANESIEPDAAAGDEKAPSTADGQSNDGNASPTQTPGQRQPAAAAIERQASEPTLANQGDRSSDAAEIAPDGQSEQTRPERTQSEARLAQVIQARKLVDDPSLVLAARLQAAAKAAQDRAATEQTPPGTR